MCGQIIRSIDTEEKEWISHEELRRVAVIYQARQNRKYMTVFFAAIATVVLCAGLVLAISGSTASMVEESRYAAPAPGGSRTIAHSIRLC